MLDAKFYEGMTPSIDVTDPVAVAKQIAEYEASHPKQRPKASSVVVKARKTDPHTSVEGCEAISESSGKFVPIIIGILDPLWPKGLSELEVSTRIDIGQRVSISPLFAKMRRKGMIEHNGERHGKGLCWRVVKR
jgi:hypothetical protein